MEIRLVVPNPDKSDDPDEMPILDEIGQFDTMLAIAAERLIPGEYRAIVGYPDTSEMEGRLVINDLNANFYPTTDRRF